MHIPWCIINVLNLYNNAQYSFKGTVCRTDNFELTQQ